MLVRCEAALENLRVAYWAAGKALQVIRDGRLYRATHPTFEDYCQEQWDITRQYANQLIRSWGIAEKLFEMVSGKSKDLERILSKKLGFGQAWELVALTEEHSVDAAALLYLALIQAKGMGVTAALVKGAAGNLPPEAAGKKKATEEAVVAYLATIEGTKELPPTTDPYKALHRATRKISPDAIHAAMERNPDGTRTMVCKLIEALSSSVGIEVEIKSPDSETAAA
ncbi:hypothetical protein ACFQ2B_40700 [Streptomyces stramineus]